MLIMDSETNMQKNCVEGDESVAADAQPSGGAVSGNETQTVIKRSIKLTEKALLDKLETLQKTRKAKLNKASRSKETIKELMHNREYETEVRCAFEKYITLCDEAKETHASLLNYLPPVEKEKHETWFKAKLLSVNDFIDAVNMWLAYVPKSVEMSILTYKCCFNVGYSC